MNTQEKYKLLLDFVINNMERPTCARSGDQYDLGVEAHENEVADEAHEVLTKLGIDPTSDKLSLSTAAAAELETVPVESSEDINEIHLSYI